MAQLQENIEGIVAAFYMCAGGDGNCSPLSREELRQLMELEFADAMENPQDPKTVKKVLCFLDDDGNCRVDFSELLSLVFRVAKACYQPLQQHQAPEDGQELTAQEKAGGEQLPRLRTAGRVSHNQQVPEQGVNNQIQDTETQDQDTHQTQEGETSKQDQDTHQTQEGETSKQDPDTHQTQEGEIPEQDQDTHQTQEGETSKQDPDTHQTQEGETPEQDQDTHQDDSTEAPEGDPESGEILDLTPEQDKNTHKAEESETSKQDPKTHQAEETEATGQGSNHHQRPETESAEQDLNCPSETRGRDPNNKIQVCKAPRQDPNPSKTWKPLPPQWGQSPHWDPEPQGMCHDPACHQLPESKVLEQEHSGAEAPSYPAQQQQDAHDQRPPAIEQQLLQSLYQWPPQQ
ncbi:repetin-like [Gymnogyps californianus]|uniref:repetin-like n=1 Tax=Gymnogyps californianus TaxID=33616 RepID=UPI0021C8D026|nr:repetin-like [Gymnogyps californianus]